MEKYFYLFVAVFVIWLVGLGTWFWDASRKRTREGCRLWLERQVLFFWLALVTAIHLLGVWGFAWFLYVT